MSEQKSFEDILNKNNQFFIIEAETSNRISLSDLLKSCEPYRQYFQKQTKDIAVLEFNNDVDSLILYISCFLEGVPLMLVSKAQMKECAAIIEGYEPKYFFSSTVGELQKFGYSVSPLSSKLAISGKSSSVSVQASSVALMLGTSGSTGSPKFVALTLKNVIANAQSIAESLSLKTDDIAITSLPLFYSYGLSVLNSHLIRGGGVVLSDKSVMDKEFWSQINQYGVTSIAGVPYVYQMMHRLAAKEIAGSKSLRYLTQAGGKLSNPLIDFFHKLTSENGKTFFVMYGQTEACARMSCMETRFLPAKLGSAGKAIPGGEFSVIDPDPETKAGEIIYSGPNVMLGYTTKRSDLNNGDINKGRLSTGDLGYMDSDGFLFITGRLKRIAKVAGVRVSLDEVEQKLSHLAPVVAINKDEKIVLFTENKSIDLDHVKQYAAEMIEAHPSFFIAKHIDAFPLNSNGKINYKALGG